MGWNYLFIPKLQCCSCWSLGIWLCTVLYGLPKFLIEKLQRVQNFSAQLFSGSYKYDHITPVLKSLHWLPVEQRIWYKIAVLGFKCVYGSAPSYLQNLVELYTPRRTLRRSNDKLSRKWEHFMVRGLLDIVQWSGTHYNMTYVPVSL